MLDIALAAIITLSDSTPCAPFDPSLVGVVQYVDDGSGHCAAIIADGAPVTAAPQLPEEVIGRAIDCPDGTVGYVVDVNGGTSCATAAPAPAPATSAAPAPAPRPAPHAAPAPHSVGLPDGTTVEVPAAEPYSFSFTDVLEMLRDLFGGFLGHLLGLR